MPYSMKFEHVDRFSMTHEDGSVEMSLSTVDAVLAKHGMFVTTNACSNGNLNKGGLWDIVLDELEMTYVHKEERMNVSRNSYETVYSVPVTAHMLTLPVIEDDRQLGSYNEMKSASLNKRAQKAEKLKKGMVKKIKRNPQQVRQCASGHKTGHIHV